MKLNQYVGFEKACIISVLEKTLMMLHGNYLINSGQIYWLSNLKKIYILLLPGQRPTARSEYFQQDKKNTKNIEEIPLDKRTEKKINLLNQLWASNHNSWPLKNAGFTRIFFLIMV